MLDRCVRTRPDFEIYDVQRHEWPGGGLGIWGGGPTVSYGYKVKAPAFVTDAVKPWCDSKEYRSLYGALSAAARLDERRSFYAILVGAASTYLR